LAAEVQVANPSRIPWLFRDSKKNDRLDARKLATLLYMNQLPQVHLPSADVSTWRALINHRRSQVKRRTMMKNQVRAFLRTFMLKCPHRSLWTRPGRTWLSSLAFDPARQAMLRTLTQGIDFINAQLGQIEVQLDAIAATQPAVALLRTIPGIGARTAEAIAAFTDRVGRFGNRKQFASYFGMTPTQEASGRIDRHGHISKRGPSVVRWVLVEATHQVVKRCPALAAFFDRVRRERKDRYKRAVVATGRKLLTIAFAMLRDGTPFDSTKVAAAA
jgi:transposase